MTEYGRIHTDGSRSGGQPTVATQKAHTMLLEVLAEWGIAVRNATAQQLAVATTEALCRAIDQIEDLRAQAQAQFDRGYYDGCANPIVRYDALLEENERLRRDHAAAVKEANIAKARLKGVTKQWHADRAALQEQSK